MTPSPGRLLVVATPLGNLGDITARAVQALRSARLVVCEDTRRTRALLSHLGSRARAVSSHKFNEAARAQSILDALRAGTTVALVTDAGTPGVSDPGARLVEAASRAGIAVEAIPGPSAPGAAISISGFPAGGFVFAGFPPPRAAARRRFFDSIVASEGARAASEPSSLPWPIVLFEAPHRIKASLQDLRTQLGDRRIVLIREMTKLHEEILRGSASGVLAELGSRPRKGEFTIVVEGSVEQPRAVDASPADLRSAYEALLNSGVQRKEALRTLARSSGRRRRDIYRALAGGRRPGSEERGSSEEEE